MSDADIDALCKLVDVWMCEGDFVAVDRMLAEADENDIERCAALLTFTCPGAKRLPAFAGLCDRVERAMRVSGDPETDWFLSTVRRAGAR